MTLAEASRFIADQMNASVRAQPDALQVQIDEVEICMPPISTMSKAEFMRYHKIRMIKFMRDLLQDVRTGKYSIDMNAKDHWGNPITGKGLADAKSYVEEYFKD